MKSFLGYRMPIIRTKQVGAERRVGRGALLLSELISWLRGALRAREQKEVGTGAPPRASLL